MTNTQFSPFIINLAKTQEGYVFHSLEEPPLPQPKNKKPKPAQPKNTHSKITNRLIKEIGLISDLPPLLHEEPEPSRDHNYPDEPQRQDLEAPQEEEEVDV